MNNNINQILDILPSKPGVYQFIDTQGEVIYVGKAKDLKKRVSSYFYKNQYESAKLRILVARTAKIKHIIVETENDALLLENNLIKKLKPKYNVLLKDDKTYPWICIKKEPFPRVYSTRHIVKDGSLYFGPYTSGVMLKALLDLIRSLYPLRNCNLSLTKTNIDTGRFKPCLELQIGNCKAPCIGNQNESEYAENIESIVELLRGNFKNVNAILKRKMIENSNLYQYELANFYKEKLNILSRFQAKSTIVNPAIKDIDVFSLVSETGIACVNHLKVINGSIVQSHNIEIKKVLNEKDEELLGFVIAELRQRNSSKAKEMVVSVLPDFILSNCKYIVPQKGDKLKLLELSRRNAKEYIIEKQKKLDLQNPKQRIERILLSIKRDFKLNEIPTHIECFDNSNLQGKEAVAACVVFRNGKPSKKEYRHFNIKTVDGPNDYASMEEVVYRRYKRLKEENISLPQLVVIDGGKGQLSSAYKSLKVLGLERKIQVIGIAKRLEEIFFPNDPIPLFLDKTSETLKITQHIRNEAHRFGLRFHRQKRDSNIKKSSLSKIDGIGEKTIELLYSHFKSYDKIVNATKEELKTLITPSRAEKIFNFFSSNMAANNANR